MVAFFVLTACLDPKAIDDGGSGDSNDTGGSDDGGTSIFDVRSGEVADGESLTLTGVLVSSPPTRADAESGKSDGFFIQDPKGGANSGLYVWSQGQFGDELTVQMGDEITVSGQISEYYEWTELVVGDVGSIEVTGAGELPPPLDLGDGAGVDWDQYESVPISLRDQTITSIDAYNTGTLTAGIKLDDGFVYNDYGCRGTYQLVTGIVFYQYESWSVNNRSEDELVGYVEPGQIDATIREIREDGVCGRVRLENVVATSASWGEEDSETKVFVQDQGGGAYSGLVVFMPEAYTAIAPGDLLTVIGDVTDYYGLAELYIGPDTGSYGVTSGGGTPVATEISETPDDWEPYESALVSVLDLTAVSDLEYGSVYTDKSVYIDNLFYDFDAENGSTWSSVTGPVYYTSYDDVPQFLIEPREASDLVE